MTWINYFVPTLDSDGLSGHILADDLRNTIKKHKGGEAYHCAFDLIKEELKNGSVSKYEGTFRPALGYVWFDFDSHDGGIQAWLDTKSFISFLSCTVVLCYSGSKGFHVGVPFSAFGIQPSPQLGEELNSLARRFKKEFKTMDTTVFNANRKFRALGSKHPKTGLYKIKINDVSLPLETIKELAKSRGDLTIPEAIDLKPLTQLKPVIEPTQSTDSISLDEWRRYRQPEGTEIFNQCGFIAWARDNQKQVNEPQWYACASIVGRMKDGRHKFHLMSKKHPDYSASKCDEKLEQALQASGPRTCAAIDSIWDGCKKCPHYQKLKSPVVILEKDVIPTEATGFYDLIKEKRIPNYNDLLRCFHNAMPFKTIADMKTVYVFKGTHYEEYTPIEIKAFAEEKFSPKPQEKLRQEFSHKVFANSIARRSFFSDTTANRINFTNGILELGPRSSASDNVLQNHSPSYGFRGVLPYSYDPRSSCDTFNWWINDVMLGDEALVKILQEFMGYVIRGGEYKYHKALWLSGSGRNGKSTFLSVLKALIGAGNYSTLSIRQIINDKFSSADLDGKIANFSEETSPEELSDSGPFKNLTGDGELLAQKKYGDPYSFRNRAKLIMTYNEVPLLRDLSPGMLSRPIIIPWKKDLTAEGAQDRSLKEKLFTELPGIFNFALAGWERLELQSDFTTSEKSTLEMEEIRSSSCSAAQWFNETIELVETETKETLKSRQLYEAYKQAVGQYAYAENKFYRRINSIPNVLKRKRHTNKGGEYFGMKFRRIKGISSEY